MNAANCAAQLAHVGPVSKLTTMPSFLAASYNAFSPLYNCPIPPRENVLDVAVRAGERDPGGHE